MNFIQYDSSVSSGSTGNYYSLENEYLTFYYVFRAKWIHFSVSQCCFINATQKNSSMLRGNKV